MKIGTSLFAIAMAAAMVVMTAATDAQAAMVKYQVTDGTSIEKSLTGKAGDPAKGRTLSFHRKKGNCLTCHVMPIPEQSFHGNLGPDLKGVASRYSAGELRLRLVDATVLNEDTIMPAFYRSAGLHRVLKKFKGKTVLSAQEIEDIVAYLMTLK